jgi:hypothetical protein
MSKIEESDKSTLLCDTPNCGKVSKLRCPTCLKLEIKDGSNFCSQVLDFNIFIIIFKINIL